MLVEPGASIALCHEADSNAKGANVQTLTQTGNFLSDIGGYTGDQLAASYSNLASIWPTLGMNANTILYVATNY